MRWWETEGRRHAGMKRVKSERMSVYALFAIVVLGIASWLLNIAVPEWPEKLFGYTRG